MTTFISGPMSGYEDFNYPLFHEVGRYLKEKREPFFSPAHHSAGHELEPPEPDEAMSWEYYMKKSLRMLLGSDRILMLPGWKESRGASLERELAIVLKISVEYWKENRNGQV